MRLPNIYKADTTILVEQQKIPERLVVSTVQVELQDRLATLTQQILSATQLQKVIDKHGLYPELRKRATQEEVIEQMRSDIDVKVEKGWSKVKPGAFKISYKATEPQSAMLIANELAGLFVDENIRSREVQATGTTEFLTTQLEEARKRLLEQEAKVSAFKQKNAGQLPGQENALLMAMTQLQTQAKANDESLSHAVSSQEMLEAELRSAEAGYQRLAAISSEAPAPAPAAGAAPVGPTIEGLPVAQPGVKKSEQLQQLLDQLLQRYTDKYPQVRAVRAELERQKLQEAREEREAAFAAAAVKANKEKAAAAATTAQAASQQTSQNANVGARISAQNAVLLEQQKERVDRVNAELNRVKTEVKNRLAEKARIDRDLAAEQMKLERLPVHEQEMISVTRDYEISRKAYEELLSKSFTANTAEDMEKKQKAERFTVLDVARMPEKPYSPRREIIYPAIVAVSLLIAFAIAVFVESRKNVLLGEWELPNDVWVLGRIPAMTDLKPIRGALPAQSGD